MGSTVTSSFTYTSLGNPLTITAPGDNAVASRTTTFGYTTDGAFTQPEALGQPLTVTDALGKVTHARYDSRGNTASLIDALGNEYDAAYNLANQATLISEPPTGQTGTGRATTAFNYLFPGYLTTSASRYDESGLLSRQVTYTYGQEGEVLAVGGSTEPAAFTYDGDYRPLTISDGNSHVTSITYNATNEVSQVTYPGGDKIQYPNYDVLGNLLKRLDGRGVETDYAYSDTDGMLSDIQYPATPALNVHLNYDGYDRGTAMSDATGSETYAYGDLDEPTSITTTYTGLPAQTFSYTYWANGSRRGLTTP